MESVSLLKAQKAILETLDGLDISETDKTELMLNLYIFLDSKNYKEDLRILQTYSKKRSVNDEQGKRMCR